jgi:hypothetical protein
MGGISKVKIQYFNKIAYVLLIMPIVFICGVLTVYLFPPHTIVSKIQQLYRGNEKVTAELFFDQNKEIKNTIDYLDSIEVPRTSIENIQKGLGIGSKEESIYLVEKVLVDSRNIQNVGVLTYFAKSNIGLNFSFIEIVPKTSEKIKGTLFFLNGHTCGPEELLGMTEGICTDDIIFDLIENDIRIVYPYKYDTYIKEESTKIQISASLVGKTIEGLEQSKIAALMKEYDGKKILVGFSHGAWQTLIASVFNYSDLVIAIDFVIPLTQINPGFPSFYYDYDDALKSIYDYSDLFRLSKADKIIILSGKKSNYTNKEFLDHLFKDVSQQKTTLIYYDEGHYVSSGMVKKIVNKEIQKIME